MNETTFNNIIRSQPIFAELYRQQKFQRHQLKLKKMRDARDAYRLLHPLEKPYRKSYFTRNAFAFEHSN